MKFSVLDRLLLLQLIAPSEGDITTLRIVRKLREDLSFSEDEHKVLKFQQEEGNIKWEAPAEPLKEIPVGDKARELVVKKIKEASEAGKLTESHLPLVDQFIPPETE